MEQNKKSDDMEAGGRKIGLVTGREPDTMAEAGERRRVKRDLYTRSYGTRSFAPRMRLPRSRLERSRMAKLIWLDPRTAAAMRTRWDVSRCAALPDSRRRRLTGTTAPALGARSGAQRDAHEERATTSTQPGATRAQSEMSLRASGNAFIIIADSIKKQLCSLHAREQMIMARLIRLFTNCQWNGLEEKDEQRGSTPLPAEHGQR